MYAKRNALTILVVMLLLSAVGYFWYRSQAQELARVTAKNKTLTQQLRGALEVAETLVYVTQERDSLKNRWRYAPKKLLNAEEPAFSLSYINWLISQQGLDLDFDFYLNEQKAYKEYTTFSYTLNGEGDYRNICALVWYMTRSPLLYQIRSVNYRRSENDPKLLNFVIQFEGYSMSKDWEVNSELVMNSPPLNWYGEFDYDAFASLQPYVAEAKISAPAVAAPRPVKPQEAPDLFEVEGASLLAITKDKAYLRARNGKVTPMQVGHPVKGGRLSRIDPRLNQVDFTIDTENGSRLVQLKIEYN